MTGDSLTDLAAQCARTLVAAAFGCVVGAVLGAAAAATWAWNTEPYDWNRDTLAEPDDELVWGGAGAERQRVELN